MYLSIYLLIINQTITIKMKKFSFLPILLLFSLVLVLPSCKDDDDGAGQNEFVLDGETFSLTRGFIEDYGSNGNGSFDFDVTFTSSGITTSNGSLSGEGEIVYIDLNTSSEEGLVAGTYTFSGSRDALTFVDGTIGKNFNVANQSGEIFNVTGGTVDISISGSETTIEFDLTIGNGSTVSGSYKGALQSL